MNRQLCGLKSQALTEAFNKNQTDWISFHLCFAFCWHKTKCQYFILTTMKYWSDCHTAKICCVCVCLLANEFANWIKGPKREWMRGRNWIDKEKWKKCNEMRNMVCVCVCVYNKNTIVFYINDGPHEKSIQALCKYAFLRFEENQSDRLFGSLFSIKEDEKNVTLYWLLIRFDHLKEPHGCDGAKETENGTNREKKCK